MHLLHFCPLTIEYNREFTYGYSTKTAVQFDEMLSKCSSTDFGVFQAEEVVYAHNIELVQHMIKLKPKLINSVSELSRTLLLSAALMDMNRDKAYLMAEALLKLGAPINGLPDPDRYKDVDQDKLGSFTIVDADAGMATPLWGVLDRSHNEKLLPLFFKNGAVAFPRPSPEGIHFLATHAPYPILLCAKNDDDWLKSNKIPRELIEKIVGLLPSLLICNFSAGEFLETYYPHIFQDVPELVNTTPDQLQVAGYIPQQNNHT